MQSFYFSLPVRQGLRQVRYFALRQACYSCYFEALSQRTRKTDATSAALIPRGTDGKRLAVHSIPVRRLIEA